MKCPSQSGRSLPVYTRTLVS